MASDPHFLPAHAALGELYLHGERGQDRGPGRCVYSAPVGAAEAAVLDTRWLSARKAYAGAAVLENAVKEFPPSVGMRFG